MTENDKTDASATESVANWVWDVERQRIVSANEPGIRFWGERSLDELIDRDFSDADEAVRDFADLMHAVLTRKSGQVKARMVLAPSGSPVRVDCRASRVELSDGRLALKVEAVRAPMGDAAEVDRLREIIERNPAPMSLFAEDGALLMQNTASEASFGPELETLPQRYAERAEAKTAMRSLLVNGTHSQAVDLLTRVGVRRHRVTMRRMHDPVSGGLAAIVFFTDIADRGVPVADGAVAPAPVADSILPVAAAAVAAGGPKTLPETFDAAVVVFDDTLKTLFTSNAARPLLFDTGPETSAPIEKFFPGKRAQFLKALSSIRSGKSKRVDLRLGTSDGKDAERWLRLEVRAGEWQGQTAWIANLADITDERRVALMLRQSVQERDRALENLAIGVATIRRDGIVETITNVGASLLGSTGAEMTGEPFERALDDVAAAAFREGLSESTGTDRTLKIERPRNGISPVAPLRVVLGPQVPERGGRRTVVFSEVATTNGDGSKGAARSEAIARASHELRTPLNAIIGFTQIMLDDENATRSETYREYLKDIHDSGQYMAKLVQDMLDMRRIEAGALSLEPGPVNVANLIRRVAREVDGAARARDVTLAVSITEELPTLIADAHTLRQALTNLVANAVKFTTDAVRISAGHHGAGALRIDVTDNGDGMTDEERDRALQPYAQGRHSSRKFGGAGMGLPLAKGFIDANGGHFDLVSKKGEGTNARIVFPPRLVESK